MNTFKTITEAYAAVMDIKRTRNDVEHGATHDTVDGVRVVTSNYCKYHSTDRFTNRFDNNYSTYTKFTTDPNDALINNFLLDVPFHVFAGGEFTASEMRRERYRRRTGSYSYRMREVAVKRSVAYTGQYNVTDVIETEGGYEIVCQQI